MYQGKRIRKYLGGKWDILHEKIVYVERFVTFISYVDQWNFGCTVV